MKIIIIFLGCLILSGCTNHTVTCIKTNKIDEGQLKEVQKIMFDNNKIDKYNINIQLKINNKTLKYKNVIFESLKDVFDKYDKKDGIEYSVKESEKILKINIEGDYDKMNEDFGLDKGAKINDVIDLLENEGYSCKY